MGSDMYMNPPQLSPTLFRSYWTGFDNNVLVIEKRLGNYPGQEPKPWREVFRKELTSKMEHILREFAEDCGNFVPVERPTIKEDNA